jgi:hypothetical protein
MFIRNLAAPVLALAGLAILATGAFAAPVQTLGQLKLHSGPGASYAVLGNLDGGVHVDVLYCGSDVKWCLISKNGKQGWVLPEELGTLGSGHACDGSDKSCASSGKTDKAEVPGSLSSSGGVAPATGRTPRPPAALATAKAP